MADEPKTLQEAIQFFSDPVKVRAYLIARRWPDGVVKCNRCGSEDVLFQEKYNRYQCGKKHSLRQFTLKTGTIFEDSPIGLDKWLMAMWMVVNCKNGVSSYEIHRAIGVTQKTAWFMDHRIRFALHQDSSSAKMGGEVEVDETYDACRLEVKEVILRNLKGHDVKKSSLHYRQYPKTLLSQRLGRKNWLQEMSTGGSCEK
jgi:transposase-like protein